MVKKRTRIRASFGSRLFDVVNYSLIVVFCITILFPLWDLIVISFSRAEDVSIIRTNLWPKVWCLDAYAYCFNNPLLGVAFCNSILRTVLGSVYHLIVCCLAAYALTRTQMPFRKTITMIFLFTMFFSGGMIPKIDCAVEAVRSGVNSTVILDGRIPHSILIELLSDDGAGTMLVR